MQNLEANKFPVFSIVWIILNKNNIIFSLKGNLQIYYTYINTFLFLGFQLRDRSKNDDTKCLFIPDFIHPVSLFIFDWTNIVFYHDFLWRHKIFIDNFIVKLFYLNHICNRVSMFAKIFLKSNFYANMLSTISISVGSTKKDTSPISPAR